jgi:hypothetical protein
MVVSMMNYWRNGFVFGMEAQRRRDCNLSNVRTTTSKSSAYDYVLDRTSKMQYVFKIAGKRSGVVPSLSTAPGSLE